MKWTEPEDYSKKRMRNRFHDVEHSGFLFFPKTLSNHGKEETRWLEFADWKESFFIDEKGKKTWKTEFWNDWWR
jgi:hypothetical protein